MTWRSNTHPQVVAVLGAGSWGTTFAKIVADAGASRATDVRVWARRPEIAAEINDGHRNSQYLKDTVLPANLTASADPAEVLAVPAQTLRAQLRSIRNLIPEGAVVVSLMKGLEVGTDSRMSQVIEEELHWPEERVAVISGPNLAMEIADRQPTENSSIPI